MFYHLCWKKNCNRIGAAASVLTCGGDSQNLSFPRLALKKLVEDEFKEGVHTYNGCMVVNVMVTVHGLNMTMSMMSLSNIQLLEQIQIQTKGRERRAERRMCDAAQMSPSNLPPSPTAVAASLHCGLHTVSKLALLKLLPSTVANLSPGNCLSIKSSLQIFHLPL